MAAPVEVQARSAAGDVWARLEHTIFSTSDEGVPSRVADRLVDRLEARLEARARDLPLRVRGRNPALLVLGVARRCAQVRVTGLAAEMCYYLMLSLVPLLTAVGAGLGVVGTVVGPEAVAGMERALTRAVEAVLSPDLTTEVAVPLIDELLRSHRVGTAAGGVAVALFLGSRVFRAAVRALSDAYAVTERRGVVRVWGLSLAFSTAAVVVVTVLLSFLVVGPLLGGGQRLAAAAGIGPAFEVLWSLGRWPVLLLVCAAFLAALYRVGHTARTRWRDVLPGTVVATVGLVALLVGFRLVVEVVGPWGPRLDSADHAVAVAGGLVGTVLAAMLLGWLASMVVLLGGVLNAEWDRQRVVRQVAPAG